MAESDVSIINDVSEWWFINIKVTFLENYNLYPVVESQSSECKTCVSLDCVIRWMAY